MDMKKEKEIPLTNSPRVMAQLERIRKDKNRKLNKLGEWLRSDAKPVFDLSVMTPKQQQSFWRRALR